MDVCNLDWSAIAGFVGAGVALFISQQWKDQKGSEVIANEAKEVIKELLDFSTKQQNFIHFMTQFKEIDSDNFTRLQDQNSDIYKRLVFIENSIDIKNFKKTIFDYNLINQKIFKDISQVPDVIIADEYKKLIEKIGLQREFNLSKCLQLTDLIRPYALYQTKFNFKKLN